MLPSRSLLGISFIYGHPWTLKVSKLTEIYWDWEWICKWIRTFLWMWLVIHAQSSMMVWFKPKLKFGHGWVTASISFGIIYIYIYYIIPSPHPTPDGCLTHWGRDKMAKFPDDIFKCIFLNENVWISIKISLKFVPKGPINNIPALVQIMAWRRHICVTRPHLWY